ncbi:MAG: lamin tail domain-containing protein, partial [Patescibacteria group bacterium]|nr:lamin tail domain-containing protein [Patescibacteria group bacterium]
MLDLKKFFKKTFTYFMVISMVFWSIGSPINLFVPKVYAEGGVSPDFISDMEGVPPMIATTSQPYAIGKFDIYDSSSGYLANLTVTLKDLEEVTGFNPADDLTDLSASATSSGMSLWKDTNGNGQFDAGSDTPAANISNWSGTGPWQATFSGINWHYDAATNTKIFLVFIAGQISTTSPKGFNVVVEQGDMVFTGGSIDSWPYDQDHYFPEVWLGELTPVVISEVQATGSAESDEFVEVYNRSPQSFDLSGWSLKYSLASASGSISWSTILCVISTTSPQMIQPGGFYLAGNGNLSTTTDQNFTAGGINGIGGYIGLFNPADQLMDHVGYGALSDYSLAEGGQAAMDLATASSSIERKAFSDSTWSMMVSGGMDEYAGNMQDSNNNAADFILRPASNSQNSSSTPELPEFGTAQGKEIIINEIYYRPETAGEGWIELYNRSDNMVSIDSYELKHKGNTAYVVPDIDDINPHSYVIVHWNQTGINSATDLYTGNIGVNLDVYGGDIVLENSGIDIIDYVEYGGSGYVNESTAVSEGEWMAGDYIPHCVYGQSIGRKSTEGDDSNKSSDWQTFSSPTPDYANMGGDTTVPSAVSSVTLADSDSNYGLDGRDITITWTPSTAEDPSFDRYEIFLLPQGTQLDFSTHQPIDNIYGGQYQYDGNGNPSPTYTYTGGTFVAKDSASALLASGNYMAYILTFDYYGNKSGTAQSAAAALASEAYNALDDHNPPYIMHMGVWNAATGSDLHLIARADDDRMLSSTTPLRIVWKASDDFSFNLISGASTTNCIALQANFYDCVIPWEGDGGTWSESSVIGYYIKALDGAGNNRCISASPDADMSGLESNVKYHPFYIDLMSIAKDLNSDSDLSGYTYSSDGNILSSTTIFFEGMAIAPAISNASGTFEFLDNILDYGMYNIMAVKDGYMTMVNNIYRGQTAYFYLNEGDMNFSSGAGDSGANPIIKWTAPFDNMSGAPIDIFCTGDCSTIGVYEDPIIIAFDRLMNASTINDQNAADSSSNIYLTSNGLDRASGKVYYDANSNEARFYSSAHNTLLLGTYYSIIVTQGVTDEFGNPIAGMNSDGSFSNGFTTIMSTSTDYTDFGTGGATMPPYVKGTTPSPGQFNVSRNSSIIIEFSEPMDSAKINTDTIQLVPITNSTTWTEGAPVAATVSLDQTTRQTVTLNPDSDLDVNYNWWTIKVKGDARSSAFMYLADPASVGGCVDNTVCSKLNAVTVYQASFQINAGDADTVKPIVMGTYPNNNDGITNSNYIDVGIGALEIGFSEAMDPSTINADNIKLLAGSSVAGGKVAYDSMSSNAKFIPYSALLANTQYTLRINADCADLAGNQLNATTSKYFKTGSADTQLPEVMYANGDDYSIAISFNEPMNSAKQTDTSNWAYSVLNPVNYAVNGLTPDLGCAYPGSWICNPNIIAPYNGATGTVLTGLGLSFSYEDYNNTVIIKGFQFDPSTTDFQVFVDNIRDRSNNEIADSNNRAGDNSHLNAARSPLYSSIDTYGAVAPGSTDYTMDMGDMGMMMAGAFPMNAIAGQNSTYFIDIPTNKSIPIGGKIIITFPAGFDVSGAAKDPYSPVNNDINERNAGKVTIHSVTGNQSARTVTIIATTSATQITDYLHMDIKSIINSNIPKDFGTGGYTADIKTFTADGALLETIYTMPFFITEGGELSISGNISGLSIGSGDSGTMTVYLGSPMTGPMETIISVNEANNPDGAYSFTNLPDGEYYIFTDPTITINNNDYFGNPHSEPIWLNGASSTKNIALQAEASGGAPITVSLTGNFSTEGVADDVDIFAGSPTGFRMKKLSDVGIVSGATTTLYLSQGDWMIGIGPSIPENVTGVAPMTDWMPPMNVYYYSDGLTPGAVNFNISGQSTTTVSGTVVDGSDAPIVDAEVYAYQPMGGFGGSFTKTATDGTFTLKIPVLGTYMVGAHKSGLPAPKEKFIDVNSNVSGVTIKITKPPYTISGKVLNSSGNAVSYASVWTWQESGWGHADTMTDSSGNYILYVNAGTWHVEADAPGIGWMEYDLALTVTDASKTNINISPSANTVFYTISGQVGISADSTYSVINTPFANMPIRAVQYSSSTGAYQGKEFNSMTNSNGQYTISVPAGAYRVDIWTQEYGELGVNNQAPLNNTLNEAGVDDKYANNPANVDASSGNITDANIVVAQTSLRNVYIVVNNAPASQEGYLNIEGVDFSSGYPEPTGFHLSRRFDNLTATATIRLADGDYFMFLDVPGYGKMNGCCAVDRDIILGYMAVAFVRHIITIAR